MALPPAFLDELRARTPMAALVGRKVKLARSGKSWKGCCPFHGEKTPSFYVYDDGYHCFGCGAHGDAIGFVMNTEGAGFVEAVERLAGEAGLEVPRPSAAAVEAERERLDLAGVLDLAAASFTRRLHEREGGTRWPTCAAAASPTRPSAASASAGPATGAAASWPSLARSGSIPAAWPRPGCCNPATTARCASCSTTASCSRSATAAGAPSASAVGRWAMPSRNTSTARKPRCTPRGVPSTRWTWPARARAGPRTA